MKTVLLLCINCEHFSIVAMNLIVFNSKGKHVVKVRELFGTFCNIC